MLASFSIDVPTSVHFGTGVAKELNSVLPGTNGAVVLVRGRSGVASASVVSDLERGGRQVHQIRVEGEPSITAVNAAFGQARAWAVTAIVACGGGAVLDLAKALRFCLETDQDLPSDLGAIDPASLRGGNTRPLIAVPTTAGTGAEVTSNAVLGTEAAKTSLRGTRLYPDTALVDPSLLMSAPKTVIIGSGLDAVTQTIEAYTSRMATPFTTALMAPNVKLGVQGLRNLIERGDEDAWGQIAWVSLSSGLALANGGLGAAHGLAAVLGARLNAPHGMLCGRLLGPVLLKNRAVAELGSEGFTRLDHCVAMLCDTFPPRNGVDELSGFDAWLSAHHVPRLRDFGADPAHFGDWATAACGASSSTKNAVPLSVPDFEDILSAAF